MHVYKIHTFADTSQLEYHKFLSNITSFLFYLLQEIQNLDDL